METVVVRLWDWPPDAVRAPGIRGVARLVRTGEEVAFTSADELIALFDRWTRTGENVRP